jgi:hypothetical protein
MQDEKAISLDAFADATSFKSAEVKVERHVPEHSEALLDGCTDQHMAEAAQAISDAIDVGAPLYNKGEHKACFVIYEGTAIKLEKESGCPGIRSAMHDGIERADGLSSDTDKAWAMRDTFDGLMDVMIRKANGGHP